MGDCTQGPRVLQVFCIAKSKFVSRKEDVPKNLAKLSIICPLLYESAEIPKTIKGDGNSKIIERFTNMMPCVEIG